MRRHRSDGKQNRDDAGDDDADDDVCAEREHYVKDGRGRDDGHIRLYFEQDPRGDAGVRDGDDV